MVTAKQPPKNAKGSANKRAQQAARGVLVEGVPENKKVFVEVGKDGSANLAWPNRLILPENLEKRILKEGGRVFLPTPNPVKLGRVKWVVNTCADPDEYRTALIHQDETFGTRMPVFNHPRAVAQTRRDINARTLQGIEGLTVPNCIRFLAEDLSDFRDIFEKEGFTYPVLIRPASSQSGRGVLRIDSENDWKTIEKSHWYGVHHYMTQYVDYAQSDGSFQKVRLRFINGTPKIRAYRDSTDWMITGTVQQLDNDFKERALAAAHRLQNDEAFMAIGAEIGRRIKLNFFGADIGIAKDGYVFFEANSAMTMAKSRKAGLRADPIMSQIYAELEVELTQLYQNPELWKRGEVFLPPVRQTLAD